MYRDMQRAEAARDKAEKEVEQLIFDQAELGSISILYFIGLAELLQDIAVNFSGTTISR